MLSWEDLLHTVLTLQMPSQPPSLPQGGAQDGMNPNQPSLGTLDGSCGYGPLPQNIWPFWSVGAVATSSAFFQNGPMVRSKVTNCPVLLSIVSRCVVYKCKRSFCLAVHLVCRDHCSLSLFEACY